MGRLVRPLAGALDLPGGSIGGSVMGDPARTVRAPGDCLGKMGSAGDNVKRSGGGKKSRRDARRGGKQRTHRRIARIPANPANLRGYPDRRGRLKCAGREIRAMGITSEIPCCRRHALPRHAPTSSRTLEMRTRHGAIAGRSSGRPSVATPVARLGRARYDRISHHESTMHAGRLCNSSHRMVRAMKWREMMKRA